MKKTTKLLSVLLSLMFVFAGAVCVWADETASASSSKVYIHDDANLLSDEEESSLKEQMTELTELTEGACVATTSSNSSYSTEDYAKKIYSELFGSGNGFVFLIDMDNREIYLYSKGTVKNKLTEARAYEITDNCYSYASDKEYYECAKTALSQIKRVMGGDKLFSSMRIITSVLFGFMFSLLVLSLVVIFSRTPKTSVADLTDSKTSVKNLSYRMRHIKTVQHVHESSSGGGSGGSGGGEGGGGGAGGGHGF